MLLIFKDNTIPKIPLKLYLVQCCEKSLSYDKYVCEGDKDDLENLSVIVKDKRYV